MELGFIMNIFMILSAAVIFVLLAMIMKRQTANKEEHSLDSILQELTAIKEEIKRVQNENRELSMNTGKLINEDFKNLRGEVNDNINANFRTMNDILGKAQKDSGEIQDKRLAELREKFEDLSNKNDLKLEQIRKTMEEKISALQEDNNKKIEQMRHTVDEKLQATLNERISQSFKLVSERLEQVHSGLGEMQKLASGVGDLKKVLSNVKTRGVLGEIQLEAILEQILTPEQYEKNVKTNPESGNFVEFAVRLPGNDGRPLYLPIDAKFPADAYHHLMEAYDAGDKTLIEQAKKNLSITVKSEAKDVSGKYICPPYTTDFAIMFLPTEGLYAEIVQMGMVETLLKEYKINIAGPTTMAALLNSLQMGFRTLAIQKRSGEVWDVLSAVKTEFATFSNALSKAQNKIRQADKELDVLVGTRTRVMQRKLRDVSEITEDKSAEILELNESDIVIDEE